MFIASQILFKILSLHVTEGFQKKSKNRKHFNVKENQLSKLYSLLDDTLEHHKTTGMGHRVLLKTHPRWNRRESGKSGWKEWWWCIQAPRFRNVPVAWTTPWGKSEELLFLASASRLIKAFVIAAGYKNRLLHTIVSADCFYWILEKFT